jgi:hypothetical protein
VAYVLVFTQNVCSEQVAFPCQVAPFLFQCS